MPSLQEIIQQRLDEATKQAAQVDVKKPADEPEDKGTEEVVDLKPKMKKPVVKESTAFTQAHNHIMSKFQNSGKKTFNSATDINDAVVSAGKTHKFSDAELDDLHDSVVKALKDDDYIVKESDDENVDEAVRLAGADRTAADDSMRRPPKDHPDAAHRDTIAKIAKDVRSQDRRGELNRGGIVQNGETNKYGHGTSAVMKYNSKDVKQESVSSQVSALLEAEGLSDEFKLQAVTIFEAAVTDRVLQIEEAMKQDFETQLSEAIESLNTEIDEFLSEAVKQWQKDNEVAIKANFNTQVNESFMDGLRQLIAEHSVEVPEGKEDALETAMSKVEELQEAAKEQKAKQVELQEQIKTLEGKSILESFRAKMTQVEFDRFKQLTESVKFDTAEQYEKQLSIVLENFGSSKKTEVKQVTESVVPKSTKESTAVVESTVAPQMSQYVAALKFGR